MLNITKKFTICVRPHSVVNTTNHYECMLNSERKKCSSKLPILDHFRINIYQYCSIDKKNILQNFMNTKYRNYTKSKMCVWC